MIVFKTVDCLNELESVTPNRIPASRNPGPMDLHESFLSVAARFGDTPSYSRVSSGLKAITRRIPMAGFRFTETELLIPDPEYMVEHGLTITLKYYIESV